MMIQGNFEAQLMWRLINSGASGMLCEPQADYGGMLDGMEAAQLMALMLKVQERLKDLGLKAERLPAQDSAQSAACSLGIIQKAYVVDSVIDNGICPAA